MTKGIILVEDFSLKEIIQKVFPDWLVLTTPMVKGVQFYPVPEKHN